MLVMEKITQLIDDIKKQINETKSTKVIFTVSDLTTIGNENIIVNRILNCMGSNGIKNFAGIIGYTEQSKVYFEEISNCLIHSKSKYGITSKHFPDLEQAIEWSTYV